MVAVNHARAQILAPHTDIDPWVGLDRSAGLGEDHVLAPRTEPAPDPELMPLTNPSPAPSQPTGRDAWGVPLAPGAVDPWASPTGGDAWATAAPQPVAPTGPSVPSTRTGLLGRVHSTGASMDLPRPADDEPAIWRPDKD